ncbi:MAG: hypothetical protein JO257_18745 [Deltaproteobacteria bacterium]|nr:hypothetical protein [Deltaproteobacteria bacterium]
MWARVHKLDRVKPLPGGGAVIVIEDERSQSQMQRVPALSSLVAIARVLSAHRALEAKYGGKGEVHYATSTAVPSFLSEVITRAGASITERDGDKIKVPPSPGSVAALIDVAFSDLAHHMRSTIGNVELTQALHTTEQRRRAAPLDKDKQPEQYWPAVLELAALAGELSRKRGGRWIDTRDMPLPFALKFPDGAIAHPTTVAQTIVDGTSTETLVG